MAYVSYIENQTISWTNKKWTHRNEFQYNFNQNTYISSNCFENHTRRMAAFWNLVKNVYAVTHVTWNEQKI